MWETTFQSGAVAGSEMVLTSAIKRLAPAAETSLLDGLTGSFRGRNVLLSVADRALDMATCHEACSVYTMELNRQTSIFIMDLRSGAINTGVNRVTGDLLSSLKVTTVEAESSDSSGSGSSGGLSALSIVIIVLVGTIAAGFGIFALVLFVRERKGKPMFQTFDDEEDTNSYQTDLESPKTSVMSPASP